METNLQALLEEIRELEKAVVEQLPIRHALQTKELNIRHAQFIPYGHKDKVGDSNDFSQSKTRWAAARTKTS